MVGAYRKLGCLVGFLGVVCCLIWVWLVDLWLFVWLLAYFDFGRWFVVYWWCV